MSDDAPSRLSLFGGPAEEPRQHGERGGFPTTTQLGSTRPKEPTIDSDIPPVITLDVGGRHFRTLAVTLNESSFLCNYIKGVWTWMPQEDGSYFLDADPDLFAHLLRFMRRPSVFPFFYDKGKGFDYDLYNKLEEEANYFGIDALAEWIEKKKYLGALKIHAGSPIVCEIGDFRGLDNNVHEEDVRRYITGTRPVYVCPRGIPVHKGDPARCGQACAKARGGAEYEYENEEYMQVVSFSRTEKFVESVCRLPSG
ncbi:hypothetical protein CC80DRAFT_554618 [Byssothecium circinans]|uniref:BTB domain-containing protein n=1 Tax=Byssothecium circinans TaxID=147558 RepID=A0A6A5TCZ0_9PLEO|nr:hypothetical protein CC80DRAFT_554618 [Byssothecium circinans]